MLYKNMEKVCVYIVESKVSVKHSTNLMLRLNEQKSVHFIHTVMQSWIISLHEKRQ